MINDPTPNHLCTRCQAPIATGVLCEDCIEAEDLRELTDDELRALAKRVDAEVERRCEAHMTAIGFEPAPESQTPSLADRVREAWAKYTDGPLGGPLSHHIDCTADNRRGNDYDFICTCGADELTAALDGLEEQ